MEFKEHWWNEVDDGQCNGNEYQFMNQANVGLDVLICFDQVLSVA